MRKIFRSLPLGAIFICGCTQVELVEHKTQHLIEFFQGKTPIEAARQMEDRYFADERRQGVNKLSDFGYGQRPPYTTRYEQIAQTDPDWLVRATAIRALNRSRDTKATPIFIRSLSDENETVRTEAAKALNNVPDPSSVPALVQLLGDEAQPRDVRIWSAAALRHYHSLEIARTLVAQLNGREFGLAWQSHKTLVSMTGKDLRYDESAWLQYFTGPAKPFG